MASVKGLTIDVGVSTSEFNKGMAKMNREIRGTQMTVNDLSRALKMEFDAKLFEKGQKQAQKALSQTEEKVETLKARLDHLKETGNINTAHYQEVTNNLQRTEAQAHILAQQLKELNKIKMDALAKQFKNVGHSVQDVGKSMAPISAIAGSILASFSAIGLSTVKTASELKTLSKQLGVSSFDLQKWNYVASQVGLSSKEVEEGFKRMQAGLSGIKTGKIDKTAQAMMELGVTAEDSAMGVAENFEVLVRRISMIEDPLLQSKYAMELFGANMGTMLIPLLQEGGESLNNLIDEFNSFNHLTDENIEGLDAIGNAMTKLKAVFNSFKEQIGVALIPLMEQFTEMVETKIVPAIEKFTNWFTSLSDETKKTITTILLVVTALAPLLLGLGGVIKMVGTMIGVVKQLSGVLTLLSAHPIIAIIGIIAGLIIYLMTTNEEFKESVMGLIEILGNLFMPILEMLMDVINTLFEAIMPIIDIALTLLADYLGMIIGYVGGLINAIMPLVNLILDILQPALLLIGKVFEKIGAIITKYLIPVFQFLIKVGETVAKTVIEIFNKMIGVIENIVNGIINFVNKIIRGINKLGKIIGVTIPELDNVEMKIKQEVSGEVDTNVGKAPEPSKDTSSEYVKESINNWNPADINNSTVNNDYSNKDIKIEVVVQNYAETVDVDDMVRQINLKLAEQM